MKSSGKIPKNRQSRHAPSFREYLASQYKSEDPKPSMVVDWRHFAYGVAGAMVVAGAEYSQALPAPWGSLATFVGMMCAFWIRSPRQ